MFDRVWEKIHSEREWGRYPKEELVRWVMRTYGSTPEREELRFLDLGCGAGSSSWFLAREGFGVVAFDGSQSAVLRTGGGVVGDAISLPFKDASFDAIVDVVCLAHNDVRYARVIVDEMARVLKPGGRIFSALPAREGNNTAYENKGAIVYYDYGSIVDLFKHRFVDMSVDWTMTCEGATYTKLWFVKASLKENCNG